MSSWKAAWRLAEAGGKLAGVLAEASTGIDGLQHVILGFGINLRPAAYPPDIADRATSIESELGRVPDAGAVLVETLCACSPAACTPRRTSLLERWRALAPSARETVEWDTPDGAVAVVTAGIDDTGRSSSARPAASYALFPANCGGYNRCFSQSISATPTWSWASSMATA
jgi:biotin-(acetyl-CoA carboxylase) ligase